MQPCIFCPSPRTRKRGEHVWDDWLNREGGKEIRRPSTVSVTKYGGELEREYPTDRLNVTLPVVCDPCNHEWMSQLSLLTKPLLEDCIRDGRMAIFDDEGILTLTSFFFLKAAVLDWSVKAEGRTPCISRADCVAFRESLVTPSSSRISFPAGLQVWIASYHRTFTMEAQALTDELTGTGVYKGYRILLVTYIVGSFIFQLTSPMWTRHTRNRHPPPFFQIIGDIQSVPIWPGVKSALWPPRLQVDRSSLQDFRERFKTIKLVIRS